MRVNAGFSYIAARVFVQRYVPEIRYWYPFQHQQSENATVVARFLLQYEIPVY